MKAFLLAAGLGTRLRPLTDHTPKCMFEIDGRPMLDIWLDEFDRAGVDEVLVNVHCLADVVRRHLEGRDGPPEVHTFFEPELLGSAGTLVANRDWIAGEEFFLACNADNLTDFDLRTLIESHRSGDTVATLTLFHAPRPHRRVASSSSTTRAGSSGSTEKPSNPRERPGQRRHLRVPSERPRRRRGRASAGHRLRHAAPAWSAGRGRSRSPGTSATSAPPRHTAWPKRSGVRGWRR